MCTLKPCPNPECDGVGDLKEAIVFDDDTIYGAVVDCSECGLSIGGHAVPIFDHDLDPEPIKKVEMVLACNKRASEIWNSLPRINTEVGKIMQANIINDRELGPHLRLQNATAYPVSEEVAKFIRNKQAEVKRLERYKGAHVNATKQRNQIQTQVKYLEGLLADMLYYTTGLIDTHFDDPSRIDDIDCINRAKQALAGG